MYLCWKVLVLLCVQLTVCFYMMLIGGVFHGCIWYVSFCFRHISELVFISSSCLVWFDVPLSVAENYNLWWAARRRLAAGVVIHTLIIWATRRTLAAVKGGDVSGCIWIVSDQNWYVNCLLPRAVSDPRICRLDREQVKWGYPIEWPSKLTDRELTGDSLLMFNTKKAWLLIAS